jgi:hypothetical protein
MKIAIMQPYLFPFIDYYQLIHAADTFVVYDDVNFIKRGWINRNRILSKAGPLWFRVPLLKVSQNKKINETRIVQDPKWSKKLEKTIGQNYRKANFYAETFALVKAIIQKKYETIDELAFQSLKSLCDYLSINTVFIRTSLEYNNHHLKGQDRILDICRQEGADTYINVSGGRALYSHKAFKQAGIQLYFMKSINQKYKQSSNTFWPNLSIIDVLMHCGRKYTQQLLNNFELQR